MTTTIRKNKRIAYVVGKFQNVLDEGNFIDVGKGVEHLWGLNRDEFLVVIRSLTALGYVKETVYLDHINNKLKKMKVDVLAPKGTTADDIWHNLDKLKVVGIEQNKEEN